MTHSDALAQTKQQTNCNAAVVHVSRGFWDDVSWETYYCPTCDQIVHTVEGGQHWWNYIMPNSIYLDEGRRLAASHNNALSDGPSTGSGTSQAVAA